MSIFEHYATLSKIKQLKDEFEADGRHCMHIHLTADLAKKLRHELSCYYGQDPGEDLMTLFGASVESIDSPELVFEE